MSDEIFSRGLGFIRRGRFIRVASQEGFARAAGRTADPSTTLLRSSGRDDKGEGWLRLEGLRDGKKQQVVPLHSVEKHFQEGTSDLSTTLRSGRDDKGKGGASIDSGC